MTSLTTCLHTDVREFDDMRSCLACGKTWLRNRWVQCQPSDEIAPYVYSDLRCLETGETIRIVVIEPGELTDPLHCTLDLSDLRHTNYHAVSYTWATEDGDDTKSHPIFIDGGLLYVTKNCDAALRRLRRLGPHSRVWVDAICINQASAKERNHQVGLMDQIYRNASRVHICIENPRSDYSDTMRRLASNTEVPNAQLKELYQCRYFNRVWVIQEVALAKAITLHVNNSRVDVTHKVFSTLCNVHDALPAPLKAMRTYEGDLSLEQLLRATLNAGCSDPRDKVYAILSLLSAPVRESIVLDYSLSTEEIFRNAVLVCIASSRSLNILKCARLDLGRQCDEYCSFSTEQFNSHLETSTKTSRVVKKPPTWTQSIHLKTLKGEPFHVFQETPDKRSSPVQIVAQILPQKQIMPCFRVRAYRLDQVRGSDQSGLDARTFLQRFGYRKYRAKYRKFSHENHGIEPCLLDCHFLPSYKDELLKPIIQTLAYLEGYGTTLFGTRHGVGVCHTYTSSEDYVFFLDGVDQALVLRPTAKTDYDSTPATESGYNKFRVVSVCSWQRLCSTSCSQDRDFTCARNGCSRYFESLPSSLHEIIEVY